MAEHRRTAPQRRGDLTARLLAVLALACGLGCVLAAAGCRSEAKGRDRSELSAQEQALADVIERRRSNLKDMGAAFKTMRDLIESGQSDPTLMKYSAKSVRGYAQGLQTWFPPGSGPELGVKTESRPEIWSRADEFREAATSFDTQAQALLDATAQPDRAVLETQFKATGEKCKSCHDRFRLDEK